MRPKQALLYFVALLGTIGSLIFAFLPTSDAQGPSAGLRARLEPIVERYRGAEEDAAKGRFAAPAAMAALRTQRQAAEEYTPALRTEESEAADDEATSAVDAYADFVESVESKRIRPIGDPEVTAHRRLTARVAQALKAGPGSGIAQLKSLAAQLALFVLLPATLVVAFAPAVFRAVRDAEIRRTGDLLHGVVVAAVPNGMMTNYVPQYRVTIRLDHGGRTTATLLSYDGLDAGDEVMVKVHPRYRSAAVIDSIKVAGSSDYEKLR